MQTYSFSNYFLLGPELDQTKSDPIVTMGKEEQEARYDEPSKPQYSSYRAKPRG